jgi:hypothetical protein
VHAPPSPSVKRVPSTAANKDIGILRESGFSLAVADVPRKTRKLVFSLMELGEYGGLVCGDLRFDGERAAIN